MKSKLIQGIYQADKETLANFISMWDESSISKILSYKSQDLYDKIKTKDIHDAYAQAIISKKEELLETKDINTLRTIILIQLAKFHNIKLPTKFNLYSIEQIGLNIEQQSINVLSIDDKNYNGNNLESMVSHVFNSLFENAAEEFRKSDSKNKEQISKNILLSIENMPAEQQKKIKEELKVDELSEDIIQKAIASGTLGAAFAATVSVAGFSAYTFATSMLASISGLVGITLPFTVYSSLTSLIAVISNPIFLLGAMGLLIYVLNSKSNNKIKGKFSPFVVSLISILSVKDSKYICESERHFKDLNIDISFYLNEEYSVKNLLENKYLDLDEDIFEQNKVFNISNIPSSIISTCDKSLDFLNRDVSSLNLYEKVSILINNTYDPYIDNTNKLITGVTVGDLIYDMMRIDPLVVESIDFARKDDIADMFSLAYFSESINIESIGQVNQLKGYVAERLVAQQLQSYGYEVEFPTSSTQAGYDLLVNGNPFQVKCGDNSSLVDNHFSKYPDIPVLVNEELGELFNHRDDVFTIPGIRNDEITDLTSSNLKDAEELLDYEIPLITIAIVSGKQMFSVLQNKTDFDNAVGKIVEESTVRITGALIGSQVLMISGAILMPAAGVVGGIMGSILGSMTLAEMVNKFKIQKLLKEETILIDNSIKEVFQKAVLIGNRNIEIAEKKFLVAINGLKEKGQEEIIQYIKYRFKQECDYRKEKISIMEEVINSDSFVLDIENKNILKCAQNALVITEQVGVHPYNISSESKNLIDSIKVFQKSLSGSELTKYIKDNFGNAIVKTNNWVNMFRKKTN